MPGPVTREEFDELADEVAGEKTVTRHILEQTRRNGDDLAGVRTRVGRVEEKVDGLDRKVEGLDRKVEALDRKVDGLARDVGSLQSDVGGLRADLHGLREALPGIVAETLRDVLRETSLKK